MEDDRRRRNFLTFLLLISLIFLLLSSGKKRPTAEELRKKQFGDIKFEVVSSSLKDSSPEEQQPKAEIKKLRIHLFQKEDQTKESVDDLPGTFMYNNGEIRHSEEEKKVIMY